MVTTIHDHNWKNAGEFLLAVVQAGNPRAQGIDGRLRPAAAAPGIRETINSEGGFLIPPTFADRIWERIYNTGEILRRCTDYGAPVGNSHFLPYFNETSRADGSRFGGCRSYWMTEAGALTDSQPDFGVQKRELKKLAGLVYVTEEMVSDAPRLAENLERMAALELQFQFEEAIVNGTGAGRPQGLLNANCKLTVSKETNQPAATIQGSNVQKMLARLWGPSWRSAVWLFNQELADVLPTLVVESGYGSGTTAVESALWDWGGNRYSVAGRRSPVDRDPRRALPGAGNGRRSGLVAI